MKEEDTEKPVVNKKPVYLSTFFAFKNEMYEKIEKIEKREMWILGSSIIAVILCVLVSIANHR